jgi:hypothetical protein
MNSIIIEDEFLMERKIPFELEYTDLAAVDMTWP